MNTIHEMLLPDLNDLKIAERRAEAVAWRRAQEATAASRSEHTWSLSSVLRPAGPPPQRPGDEGHLTLTSLQKEPAGPPSRPVRRARQSRGTAV